MKIDASMNRLRRSWLLSVFAALLFVGAAACGGEVDEDAVAGSEAVTAPEAQADSANAYGAVTDMPADANVVRVYLEEYRIDMPETLPAGPTRFEIVSRSQAEPHSFEIEGEGLEVALEAPVRGGETQQLYADLAPGSYTVYCPVDDHAEHGMTMQVTVVAAEDAGEATGVR